MSQEKTRHLITLQEGVLGGARTQMKISDSQIQFDDVEINLESIERIRTIKDSQTDLLGIGSISAHSIAGGVLGFTLGFGVETIIGFALIAALVGYIIVSAVRDDPFVHFMIETEQGVGYKFGVATAMDSALLFRAVEPYVEDTEQMPNVNQEVSIDEI